MAKEYYSIAEIAQELNCSAPRAKIYIKQAEQSFRKEFNNRLLSYGIEPSQYLEEVFDTVFSKGSSLSRCENED